jgi:hypothetical protein
MALASLDTRSLLYWLARFLGDSQAVKNGRIGKAPRMPPDGTESQCS